MAKKSTIPEINIVRCKGCSLCVAFCPNQVFEADVNGKPLVKMPEKCTGCLLCEHRCPDFALTIVEII